jgi:hypothetical protein
MGLFIGCSVVVVHDAFTFEQDRTIRTACAGGITECADVTELKLEHDRLDVIDSFVVAAEREAAGCYHLLCK